MASSKATDLMILFDPSLWQVQSLRVRLGQEVRVIKGYSTFPKAPGLKPQYHMRFSVISRTLVGEGCSTPPQINSRHILQPLLTEFRWFSVISRTLVAVRKGSYPLQRCSRHILQSPTPRSADHYIILERQNSSLIVKRLKESVMLSIARHCSEQVRTPVALLYSFNIHSIFIYIHFIFILNSFIFILYSFIFI